MVEVSLVVKKRVCCAEAKEKAGQDD